MLIGIKKSTCTPLIALLDSLPQASVTISATGQPDRIQIKGKADLLDFCCVLPAAVIQPGSVTFQCGKGIASCWRALKSRQIELASSPGALQVFEGSSNQGFELPRADAFDLHVPVYDGQYPVSDPPMWISGVRHIQKLLKASDSVAVLHHAALQDENGTLSLTGGTPEHLIRIAAPVKQNVAADFEMSLSLEALNTLGKWFPKAERTLVLKTGVCGESKILAVCTPNWTLLFKDSHVEMPDYASLLSASKTAVIRMTKEDYHAFCTWNGRLTNPWMECIVTKDGLLTCAVETDLGCTQKQISAQVQIFTGEKEYAFRLSCADALRAKDLLTDPSVNLVSLKDTAMVICGNKPGTFTASGLFPF